MARPSPRPENHRATSELPAGRAAAVRRVMRLRHLWLWLICWLPTSLAADVVKPALVEISVYADGHYEIELRASIEALLTGIDSRYKNTREAPTAEEYDVLRRLAPDALRQAFVPFEPKLLREIVLRFDGQRVTPRISRVEIPPRGYTKIPRISVIRLLGRYPKGARELTWYYPAHFGNHAVRVRQVDQSAEQYHWSEWQWIRDDSVSKPFSITEVASRRGLTEVVTEYVEAGFNHILPRGLDHILFILGLYLFAARIRPLLWQVTMFTLAHTITLGLAVYGWLQLPEAIVQPLIALSIAYVGIENIWHRRLQKSRLALVFGFGLLHGIGFASMLEEFGMPKDAFATALVSFNVGVELGQITIIAIASALTGLWFGRRGWYRHVVVVPFSLLISVVALYWFWDRLEWDALRAMAT
ncbi:MAG: HupE/UreJ family protein [Gammaproteobacteria bacterium]|nr:MAG: HupE/UreJ family protein [Gammaproteobacteria bacterium]